MSKSASTCSVRRSMTPSIAYSRPGTKPSIRTSSSAGSFSCATPGSRRMCARRAIAALECVERVRAHHAAARRQRGRLDHAGEAETLRDRLERGADRKRDEPWHREAGGQEPPVRPQLVERGLGPLGGVPRHAEQAGHAGGQEGWPVPDREHPVHGPIAQGPDDLVRRRVPAVELHGDRRVAPRVIEAVAVVAGVDEVDGCGTRRILEGPCLIAGRLGAEQNALHDASVTHQRRATCSPVGSAQQYQGSSR